MTRIGQWLRRQWQALRDAESFDARMTREADELIERLKQIKEQRRENAR